MTVSSETSRSGPYIGNGLTTVFAYGFRILEEGHIRVVKLGTDGIEADQVLSTDYTVSGIGDANGGNITLLSAPEIGETITIVRNVPLTQGTDFENQGAYFAQTHEDAFDRLSMQMQQVNEAVDRSVKVQVSDDDTDPDALIDSIAASESAAATSAGAAATSAGAASSSETNAAHSATEAAQSAANAGTNVVAAETSPAGLAEGKEWWDSANGKLYVEHEGRLIQANHTTNVPGDADSLQIATNLASINTHNVRLTALEDNALGAGQVWQDITASRAHDTPYQNTTGKPIMVAISSSSEGQTVSIEVSVDNATWITIGYIPSVSSATLEGGQMSAIIPAGSYYRTNTNGQSQTLNNWAELS